MQQRDGMRVGVSSDVGAGKEFNAAVWNNISMQKLIFYLFFIRI